MNKKLILLILIVILISINYKPEPQSLIPECFEHKDCIIPIPRDYCDVKYECISGKCYDEVIKCPEICYGGRDEDLDNTIDCDDRDC